MTPALVSYRTPAPGRSWLRVAAAAALLLPAAGLRAQIPSAGTLDPTFDNGVGVSTIYAVDYETDSGNAIKVTVGGDRAFGAYLNTVNADGSNVQPGGPEDARFRLTPFGNAARIIFTVVPEQHLAEDSSFPNLLVGGSFDGGFGRGANSNKSPQNIVRIAPDGSQDTGFAAAVGTGANAFVTSIVPLKDGRIVVGGLFTAFNKQPRRRIVRLLGSGAVDSSFATGSNIDNDVLAVAESIDPANDGINGSINGSIYVGGIFNRVAGQSYAKLARLDPNGNLDMSFHPNIDLRVNAILVQPDGKIIIGGDFTSVNGVRVSRLARLGYDGSLDPTFVGAVSGVPNNDVNPTAVNVLRPVGDSDGRIYIGGEFAQINGVTRRYLGLISKDGVLDLTFDPVKYINNAVQSIAIQSDGKVLVGQTLGPRINNKFPSSIVRLYGGPVPLTTLPVNE